MSIALITRTVVLGAWVTALLVHSPAGPRTAGIALAMTLVWAAPLIRDGIRARPSGPAPAWRVGHPT